MILDRVNYAISLLEEQPAGTNVPNRHLVSDALQAVSPASLTTPRSSGQDASTNASPSNAFAVEGDLSGIPEYPASVMSCEATMRWPVFAGSVPDVQSFILEIDDNNARPSLGGGGASVSIREEDFITLSKRFLAYVHVKNPILDLAEYRSYVREAALNGISWDGPSCLVV